MPKAETTHLYVPTGIFNLLEPSGSYRDYFAFCRKIFTILFEILASICQNVSLGFFITVTRINRNYKNYGLLGFGKL